MFKKIPGNNLYRINLNKHIVNYNGEIVDLCVENDKSLVSLTLFGKQVLIKRDILFVISWCEIDHICDLETLINTVVICETPSKILRITCGFTVVYTQPIEYIDGFRHIPNFSRYAISVDGEIIDTFTNEFVDKTMVDSSGYPCVYIYNPNKSANRWVRVHRLVAHAWLPNTDFITRPYVNHLNGKKEDYSLKNLEWCTLEENSQHAMDTGLNPCCVKMKTRDKVTGVVEVYNSASELKRRLGLTGVTASAWKFKMPGYLLNNRYEIKMFNDDGPWFYENHSAKPSKAIFTIKVLNKENGEVKTFIQVSEFAKEYKLKNRTNRLEDYVSSFKEMYPHFEISYKRNSVIGPYTVVDLRTGVQNRFMSIIAAGLFIGITRTELQYDLSRSRKFIYSGVWLVLHSGSKEFDTGDYTHKEKTFCGIEILNNTTGEKIIAKSIKAASQILSIDPRSIGRCLKSGNILKNYTFRPVRA